MKISLEDVIRILRENEKDIRKYGVKEIFVFGSVVRGEFKEGSDIDIFVDFGPDGMDFLPWWI